MTKLNAAHEHSEWVSKIKDSAYVEELKKLSEEDIQRLFSYDLTFGTAGARSQMGPGWSQFNIYTIRKLTWAFISYLKDIYPVHILKAAGIVICHDNRLNSADFAMEIAKLLSDNNIKVYIAKDNELKTTPFCSFAIRKLQATAGIMITASHNPKADNGFKVYDKTGAQLLPDATNKIQSYLAKFDKDVLSITTRGFSELMVEMSESLENEYVESVKSLLFYPSLPKTISITYTPLHGTGYKWAPQILTETGFTCHVVEEQATPDGNFPTIDYPNPESEACYKLAIEKAKENGSTLILLNDPDADRFGVAYKNRNGEFQILTGNEIATFLTYFLANEYQKRGYPLNWMFLATTYVSSSMPSRIAADFKIKTDLVATGFKFIADKIEKSKEKLFFAFEEALGFLLSPVVRDKDGLQPLLVFSDAVNYYASQNLTIDDVFTKIYEKYGHVSNMSYQLSFDPTMESMKKIAKIMTFFRNTRINAIGELKIANKQDYSVGNHEIKVDLLSFDTVLKDRFLVRPSGTEPKLKFYVESFAATKEEAIEKSEYLIKGLKNIVDKALAE